MATSIADFRQFVSSRNGTHVYSNEQFTKAIEIAARSLGVVEKAAQLTESDKRQSDDWLQQHARHEALIAAAAFAFLTAYGDGFQQRLAAMLGPGEQPTEDQIAEAFDADRFATEYRLAVMPAMLTAAADGAMFEWSRYAPGGADPQAAVDVATAEASKRMDRKYWLLLGALALTRVMSAANKLQGETPEALRQPTGAVYAREVAMPLMGDAAAARARAIGTVGATSTTTIGQDAGRGVLTDVYGVVLTKVWVTKRDSRVRPSHRDAEGQEVPIDGKFIVGGHECDGPGDPSLPIEETAGCRCRSLTRRYTGVVPASVSKSYGELMLKAANNLREKARDPNKPFKAACVMAPMPAELSSRLAEFAAKIPDAQLADDGRQSIDNFHATVLYGIASSDPNPAIAVASAFGSLSMTLGNIGIFETGAFDVVKIDVTSDDLVRLNAALRASLPHTETHLVFSPHITLGNVQPGMGKFYAGMTNFSGVQVTVDSLLFQDTSKQRTVIPLRRAEAVVEKALDASGHEHAADGRFGSGGGSHASESDSPHTASAARRAAVILSAATKAGISVPGHVLHAFKAIGRKALGVIEKRYGPKVKKAVGLAVLVSLPIPVPGMSAMVAAPILAFAELHRQLLGKSAAESVAVDSELVKHLAEQVIREMYNGELPTGCDLGKIEAALKGDIQIKSIEPAKLPVMTKAFDATLLRLKTWNADHSTPFTVAVDLDGTLAKQEPHTAFNPDLIGEPRTTEDGMPVRELMQRLREAGCRLIINTVRGDNEQVRQWLTDHGIEFDFVNVNPDQPPGSSGKLIADVYLDDRGIDAQDLAASFAEVLDRATGKSAANDQLLSLPDCVQPDDFSCGPACVLSITGFYDVGLTDLESVKCALQTDQQQGTTPQAIVEYLDSLGLECESRHNMTVDDLRANWRRGIPHIVLVQDYGPRAAEIIANNYGHYVIVVGFVEPGFVVVQDPSADLVYVDTDTDAVPGLVLVPESVFVSVWHDADVVNGVSIPYNRFGIAVGPLSPVADALLQLAAEYAETEGETVGG